MSVDEESGKEKADEEDYPATFNQLSIQVPHVARLYYFVPCSTYWGGELGLFRSAFARNTTNIYIYYAAAGKRHTLPTVGLGI